MNLPTRCQITHCVANPEWLCDWNMGGSQHGNTLAYCSYHKKDKYDMAINWRLRPDEDPFIFEKLFWEEFNS